MILIILAIFSNNIGASNINPIVGEDDLYAAMVWSPWNKGEN